MAYSKVRSSKSVFIGVPASAPPECGPEYKIKALRLQARGLLFFPKEKDTPSERQGISGKGILQELLEPIGVLGYGLEGASTSRFLLEKGYRDILVFDRKQPQALHQGLHYAGARDYLSGLSSVKTLFRSAGIRPDLPEITEFIKQGGILTSQTELAVSLAGRGRVVGVTGTLGKGTCCSILYAMLMEAGIPCRLGGNIGIPALDEAAALSEGELLLLELSSFQLSTFSESPASAIVLRTTSEHLDWHRSQQEYWLHKSRLVSGQEKNDLLVYCADAAGSVWIAERSPARKIAYGVNAPVRIDKSAVHWPAHGFSLPLADTQLTGAFNLENLAAAGTAALEMGAKPAAIAVAAAAFRGLEHRLEFVRAVHGVRFYNDSYATRPEAVMGAVDALGSAPLGLILGGSEKHADFSELTACIMSAPQMRAIALIGQTAERLHAELRAAGFGPALRVCRSLEDALAYLISEISTGAIALSPACASFGMFENYKERGKAFKRLVESI